jgi:hypothetical protein
MAPAVPVFARLNRAFLHRAVRYVPSQGVSQFLDVGAGLPTQQSVHEAARTISYLIMSHGTAHGAPPQVAARSGEARRVYDNATSRITYRDPAGVSQFLNGFSLVEPGPVHISQWRPPTPVPYEFDGFLAAVGRKE